MDILRVDSDARIDRSEILTQVKQSHIIIGTHAQLSLIQHEDITHIVFLLFESDLTLPDYRMEEEVYHTLEYAKKS